MGACQSAPEDGGAARSNSNRITLEELDEFPSITVMQAIQRLRPGWLRARISTVEGGQSARHTAQVFLDGMPLGGLDTLHDLDVREVQEIRFLSASDATTRYGTGYPRGIIEVMTKRAP